ncbi:PREDICTED: uncharacterized protein LOC100636105 isoform X2 [Amphimedon queenslandica]|uniref:Uncharacterized protein n=1 Tax=Amphimedon queenslandica TaxID=400682 RepID=A0AAN0JYQ3_AMPQE|nr:PREDICTED: uncharacterized protein LOC100636105 isoform X2 [Amphimedon queenslandica]|eukprot:XP_019862039.1 PREDICTED: uncharacterized protein LOC100636105 isoform X2 [Amphimedon queenslandica]
MDKRTPTHFVSADLSSSTSRAYVERAFIPLVVEQSGEEETSRRMPSNSRMKLSLPLLPVLFLALFHFSIVCLALLAALPTGYFFVHLLLMLMAIWSTQDKKGVLVVAVYIYLMVFSLLVDLITIGVYWDVLTASGYGRFALLLVFSNFFSKIPSTIYTVFILYQKSDGFKFSFLPAARNNGYSEIRDTVTVDIEAPPGSEENSQAE